jgi:hypothetical protein
MPPPFPHVLFLVVPPRLLDDADEGLFHVDALAAVFATLHLRAHLCRRADGQHLARVLDHDAVAVLGFFHEVRGDDDGGAAFGQRRDAAPELAARQRVGAAGGLVQEQDLGLVQQAGGHGQALLVAAGQLAAGRVEFMGQVELPQHGVHAFAHSCPRRP